MSDNKQWVYGWGELEKAEAVCGGDWDKVRSLLGGKGANLARMVSLKLNVPPGFTITTEVCTYYMENNALPPSCWESVLTNVALLESQRGKKFGDVNDPLLFSCRSGAKFSMPGMMDTVLNIGLNDANVSALGALTTPRFAFDAYRRLIQGFGSVVLDVDDECFEDPLKQYKKEKGYASDVDMKAEDWSALATLFKEIIKKEKGIEFPQSPVEQLRMSVLAVLQSWNSKRAFSYRNAAKIAHTLGTACNIQTMAFGNKGNDSGTGVAFTRNPATGENKLYGDFLVNAQGEDVVAGIRNAEPVSSMEAQFPEAFKDFVAACQILEHYFKNMQDIEFTIEDKQFFMLQCRDGKRTSVAAVRIAVEMVAEGLITKEEAVQRVSTDNVKALMHPQLDPKDLVHARKEGRMIAKGVNASPGGAVGQVYFSANEAEKKGKEEGQDVVLVRQFTKPDDVHGFFAAKGVLTAEGGATSHAAVVARQFGLPCVCGASSLDINAEKKEMRVAGNAELVVREGDWLSLDGSTGEVFIGKLKSQNADFSQQKELHELLLWADEISSQSGSRDPLAPGCPTKGLDVHANADCAEDAAKALAFGATGVGLCRTEHMFFQADRLPIVQEMILGKTEKARESAIAKLLPLQRSDFEGLFTVMDGKDVTIRLIDPPLHEFLPSYETLIEEVATLTATRSDAALLGEKKKMLDVVAGMHETNPMMGLRGVRLSIVMPDIPKMQARAIMEAACNVKARGGNPKPEIMIPLTDCVQELTTVKPIILEAINAVFAEKGIQCEYKLGTMIETPRACLVAEDLAGEAEFFSFGTNDLTQMTYGFSRDDAERSFLLQYVEQRILPTNPFQTLDDRGVARLMRMAVSEGHAANPSLRAGICGEHGGDPDTITLCHRLGLDYVSCSPYRVPVARLAAAHAVVDCRVEYHQLLPAPKAV